MASIIRPFQSARTLSSTRGRGLLPRASNRARRPGSRRARRSASERPWAGADSPSGRARGRTSRSAPKAGGPSRPDTTLTTPPPPRDALPGGEGGGRRVEHGQGRVVVEHLLEVGSEPLRVGRVAVEAAPQVVVDPALGHPLEGPEQHLPRWPVALSRPVEEEEQVRGRGKLGGAAEPPEGGVEALGQGRLRLLPHAPLAPAPPPPAPPTPLPP